MRFLGNLLWLIFGGLASALGWALAGALWCVTILGIPVGMQCFKFAALSLCPFGKEVVFGGGAGSVLLNILWLVLTGLPMALAHSAWGCLLCVTVIGIPFGLQFFKLARLSLFLFGSQVRHSFL